MNHIPILVVERIVAFADSSSLAMLSCCSKWLWYCVSQQNSLWYQRYEQCYNLADVNEIKWLAWYVKTVCASKLMVPQAETVINSAQLNNLHIEWFHTFCYRRATDANWLRDTPYPIKDVVKEETVKIQSVVLQRIAYYRIGMRGCFIVEQCQPIGEMFTKRFWRLRKSFQDDVNYESYVEECLMSDRFVVTISKHKNSAGFIVEPCIISIWPVHQVSSMRPRQFPCLCDNASIRGRWMLINHLKPPGEEKDRSNLPTITRIFDLANGQRCMGTITNHQGETFLLKATEEAATVFSRTLHHSDTTTTFKWNVWEFSNHHLGYGPRCLMQGEIRFNKFKDSVIIVKKLDDNRVLIENHLSLISNMARDAKADEIRLAMISTECGLSNDCIKDAKPNWTRSDGLFGTVPLVGSNRIIVISERGWTIHSIIDGVTLAHINVETLSSMLEPHSFLDMDIYTNRFSLHIGRFVLYSSKYNSTFVALDLINSNRTRNLGIENSKYLHEKSFEHPYIITRFNYMIKDHLLLNDSFKTRNAMLMVNGEDYKIIDMSF